MLGLPWGKDQKHPLGSSQIWVPSTRLHRQWSGYHLEQPQAGGIWGGGEWEETLQKQAVGMGNG